MGGFHATLCPDEVARYAESVVVGEAEEVWPRVIDDFRHGRLRADLPRRPAGRPSRGLRAGPRIFRGKRYLPDRPGRGRPRLPLQVRVLRGAGDVRRHPDAPAARRSGRRSRRHSRDEKKLFFFVDDNITSNLAEAKEFFRALAPLRHPLGQPVEHQRRARRGVPRLLARSGCQGVLIGFESLNPANLAAMNKALQHDARRIRVGAGESAPARYPRSTATFIFGYDGDTAESFARDGRVRAGRTSFYIAAFNHLTPFPGTPLYRRLRREERLLFDAWWLDERYATTWCRSARRHGAGDLQRALPGGAPRRSTRWPSILRRGLDAVNRVERVHVQKFLPDQQHAARSTHCGATAIRSETSRGRDRCCARTSRKRHRRRRREIKSLASFVLRRELASAADDEEIRSLLRETVFPGAIKISLEREPTVSLPERLRERCITPSLRATVGPASWRRSPAAPCDLVSSTARPCRSAISDSFALLRATVDVAVCWMQDSTSAVSWHQKGDARVYLASVVLDNQAALGLLNRRRPGWPRFEQVARLTTFTISVRRPPTLASSATVVSMSECAVQDVLECLQRNNARYQFAPVWTARDLIGATPGLSLAAFRVAEKTGRVVGCAALWDQRALRQVVVRGYARGSTS